MFIVLLDEPGLFVFASQTEAERTIEPPEAESDVRAAFDDAAIPYRVEWIRPNKHGRKWFGVIGSIKFGDYRFVPAGAADDAALVALLERHQDFTNPPEAANELRTLLQKLRAV
jgi:hypothetical protein